MNMEHKRLKQKFINVCTRLWNIFQHTDWNRECYVLWIIEQMLQWRLKKKSYWISDKMKVIASIKTLWARTCTHLSSLCAILAAQRDLKAALSGQLKVSPIMEESQSGMAPALCHPAQYSGIGFMSELWKRGGVWLKPSLLQLCLLA